MAVSKHQQKPAQARKELFAKSGRSIRKLAEQAHGEHRQRAREQYWQAKQK